MRAKTVKLFIFLFFSFKAILAQDISVTYLVKVNKSNTVSSTEGNYILAVKGDKSLYFSPNTEKSHLMYYTDETVYVNGNTMVKLDDNTYASDTKDKFYKDYKKNTITINEKIINKDVLVMESLDLFVWEIDNKKDSTILNQKCVRATTTFRGRDYEAYFSQELHPYGGPWKFDGLPGIILAVKSLDNMLVIEPLKIVLNPNNFEIKNTYENAEEVISWEEMVNRTEIKLKKIAKMMNAKLGGGEIEITGRIEDLGIKKIAR